MATTKNTPITLDLPVIEQSINTDIESIAPKIGFSATAFDVANSTITATVQNNTGAEALYRLVIHADVEAGTHAEVRVVSGDTATYKNVVEFERITDKHASIIEPVLAKAGIPIDANLPKQRQIIELAKHFKIADIAVPSGTHILRIRISQVLHPAADNPKAFKLSLYAPLLCFAPDPRVTLTATIMFPYGFQSQASQPVVGYAPLPGQPTPTLTAGGNSPVTVADQLVYGWTFRTVDPIITAEYTYN